MDRSRSLRRPIAPMTLWVVRLAWSSLPLTAGPAAGDALARWSTPPRTLAEMLLWAAWATGLVALVAAGVGAVLVIALPAVSFACANAVAYGDERRYPLRTPPVLWLGPLPVAPLLAAGGLAVGPLLLADGRIGVGIVALVVGLPLGAFAARSLHSLSGRWAVLVPAGLVLVDPMTLPDPVLLLRERIEQLRAVPRREPIPPSALDLRLGARGGSATTTLDRPAELLQTRRGLRAGAAAHPTVLCFATVYRAELLAAAAQRRIRVNV